MSDLTSSGQPVYAVSEPIALPGTPMRLLEMAIAKGAGMEQLEKLMALQERYEANESRKAYTVAFADFKRNMPDVVKDLLNKQYGSEYSSLANLVNTTNRELGKWGLNARWEIDQSEQIAVTCILTHSHGHSERVRIQGPADTSGQKNSLQQIKSTLTYLEGATFQAITGVVARASSKDDDGNGSNGEMISTDQATELTDLARENGVTQNRFFTYMKVESMQQIPKSKYQTAKAAIQSMKKVSQ